MQALRPRSPTDLIRRSLDLRRGGLRATGRLALSLCAALVCGCNGESQGDANQPEAPIADAGDPTSSTGRYVTGGACDLDGDCPMGRCARSEGQAAKDPGYCTAPCARLSDCDSSATCVGIAGVKDSGQCLPTCFAPEDCRAGFRCVGAGRLSSLTVPGACRPEMPSSSLADGVVGKACAADADCAGGLCAERAPVGTPFPDRYCSGRCYEDSACGADGVCLAPPLSADVGHCLRACRDDAGCARPGYRCIPLNDGARAFQACLPGAEPLPDGVVGAPCQSDNDCADGSAKCLTSVPIEAFGSPEYLPTVDGYCSQGCYYDADCGADGQCIASGKAGGMCLLRCSDERPCRDGYDCVAHLRDGDTDARICIPPLLGPDPDADAGR